VSACALAAAAALAYGARAAPPAFLGPFGTGGDRVWLLLPRSQPERIVVFLHGWKVAPPSPSYPWVGQFRPWLDHLAARGAAIVFPAYQLGGDVPGAAQAGSLRRGLSRAFRRLPHGLPVVVAGYSYGASLAFAYAANARAWRLPEPAAVDAVFPAGPVTGVAMPALLRPVRALIQVGDRDTVAGRAGADWFLHWLSRRRRGEQRLEVVRSRPGFAAVHAAPKLATAPARRAFWSPLDALIARA
jgi:acetyl esterase/lipase